MEIKKALTIGGSDPSGGAGIQADMRTFLELGIYPYTAITAVTAQNSDSVIAYEPVSEILLQQQIEAVLSDGYVSAIKTGMLASVGNIEIIADILNEHRMEHTLVDPVIKATAGSALLSEDGLGVLIQRLLPVTFMVTPNIAEAELLTGVTVLDKGSMFEAAQAIRDMGVAWVLLKGGHMQGEAAIDLLYDGVNEYYFESKKVNGYNVRGTGCMMASAISSYLIHGFGPVKSVSKAKEYVLGKIESAVALGRGSRQAVPSACMAKSSIGGSSIENRVD